MIHDTKILLLEQRKKSKMKDLDQTFFQRYFMPIASSFPLVFPYQPFPAKNHFVSI